MGMMDMVDMDMGMDGVDMILPDTRRRSRTRRTGVHSGVRRRLFLLLSISISILLLSMIPAVYAYDNDVNSDINDVNDNNVYPPPLILHSTILLPTTIQSTTRLIKREKYTYTNTQNKTIIEYDCYPTDPCTPCDDSELVGYVIDHFIWNTDTNQH